MARRRIEKTSSIRQGLLLLLAINALPLLGLGFMAYRVHRGEAAWRDLLSDGVARNGPYVVLGILAVTLFAYVVLPGVQAGGRKVAAWIGRADEARRGGGAGRVVAGISWPFERLAFGLLFLLRGLAVLGSLATLAFVAVFIVRMLRPEFLSAWLAFLPEDPFALVPRG